ncbi:acyl-CoA dehydrogenase [Angustibacter sp. McL0619]|uniref:acyl-CoA dehydrogenase family protein n=1 Tax=Angustibacter sp. McL0619 TaxID=3415676 RepID=UPI003CF2EBB6
MTTTHPADIDTTDASTDVRRELVGALVESLGGRWAHVRAAAREEFRADVLLPDPTLDVAQQRERVREQMRLLAGTGHAANGFPVSAGGRGDVGASVTAFEMLGHTDLSLLVKAGVQWGLFGGAVTNLGTERHHSTVLPQIISLELPGCFAMTETGHGSDVMSLGTTATYDPATDELVVHTPTPAARKDYIGGAAQDARMAVVFAQLITGPSEAPQRHGVHGVLVPLRDDFGQLLPGVHIEDCGPKMGLNGVDNGRLVFDQVRVPRTNLLNRYGDIDAEGSYHSPIENPTRRFFTMLGTLVRGRISVAGGAGAATRTALSIAIRYAAVRTQFTAPGSDEEVRLLDYRTHQRRLLPALATSYALAYAQNDLVALMHDVQTALQSDAPPDETSQRELESLAAGVKVMATWHATRTIQECREACGGAGYLAENRLPALKADTDVFTTFEGDNVVLLQLVAKGLLTSYRDAFGDLDTLGTLRFVARQVASTVAERTSARTFGMRLSDARTRGREDGDLLDRAVQLRLLADREEHVLSGLAQRMRVAGRPGADAFAVFNDAQDHVLLAARAHVERVVAQSFADAVERCADPAARELLDELCTLHVLSGVERDRAWYLEHGRLTAARSKQVVALVNASCARIRPHALELVDGFGIPDAWLAAPIALPS